MNCLHEKERIVRSCSPFEVENSQNQRSLKNLYPPWGAHVNSKQIGVHASLAD